MKRFLSLLVVLWLLPSYSVLRGEITWNLVTDATTLTASDQIIIASSQKNFAMSTTQNANNRGQAPIVKNGDQCSLTTDVQVITLQEGTKPNTFALYVGNGYLYAASSSTNQLKTKEIKDDDGSFLITIAEDGTVRLMAQGDNSNRYLRYYNNVFSCYNNTAANVCIYKRKELNQFTVTYDENGTTSQVQYIEDEIVTLKTPIEINGFVAQGWTQNPMTSPSDTPPSDLTNSFTVTEDMTFYAVYALEESGDYQKVTSSCDDYSGTYLIVNENNNVVFDGSLENLDVALNTINVDFNGEYILSNESIENAFFTISKTNDGYSIKSASEYYIGRTANSTGLNQSRTTVYDNVINIDENGDAVVTASNSMVLRYNNVSGQNRFRFYPNTQQTIQLYKKATNTKRCFCTTIDIIYEPLTVTENTTWNNPTSLYNTLTINDNATLYAHRLGNKTASNIIIEDGGQIDCNDGVFGTVLKQIAASSEWGNENAASDGWYGISSPIQGDVETSSVSGLCTNEANDYDLYSYSERESVWLNSKNEENSFSKLNSGEGYLYASKEGTTLRFSGLLNSKNIYKIVCYSSDNESLKGFNLLGNPFPKAITLTNIEGVTFSGFYLATNAGAWEAHVGTTDAIKPCEAFLVQTNSGAQTCIKNIASPTRKNIENNHFISIKIENSQFEDVTYAFLNSDSNNVMQMSKIKHRNAAIHSVSINNNAIASFDEDVSEIPISFKATMTAKHKISVKIGEELDIDYLHLIDRFTGEDIDMLAEDDYEFIGSPVDNENRFVLKLKPNECDVENESFIFHNGNNLIINGEGTIQVIDMLGRICISKEVHGEAMSVSGLTTGVYIVRIIGNNMKSQKIIVK